MHSANGSASSRAHSISTIGVGMRRVVSPSWIATV
jgi:hypothetical protein